MCFHFDNRNLAADHLILNGWTQPIYGKAVWVSKDGTCKAFILPITGSGMVMVSVGPI